MDDQDYIVTGNQDYTDKYRNYMDKLLDWLESTTPEERLAEADRLFEEAKVRHPEWAGRGFTRRDSESTT